MDKYIIDAELAHKLMNYLAGRPWIEVNALIHGINQAAKSKFTAPSVNAASGGSDKE